jgi:hypothetical protein
MRRFVLCRGLRWVRRMPVVGRGVKLFSHRQFSICSVFAQGPALPFSRRALQLFFGPVLLIERHHGFVAARHGVAALVSIGVASA